MGSEPFTRDWDMVVRSDLAPHLLPPGPLRCMQRPVDVAMVPDGARQALARDVGRHGLEDMLVVPALVRPGPRWRHCLYSPPCVLGIGERGLGLWVQAPPVPDVRVMLPFGAVAAVERRAEGTRRQLIVAGPGTRLSVLYEASGDSPADTWIRRLRRRCAGPPEPLPARPRTRHGPPRALRPFLIDGGDDAVTAGPRALPWRGPCLLAVTSREIVVSWSRPAWPRPWRTRTRTVYVPRSSVAGATASSRALLLCTTGASVPVRLPSRAVAAAAARWLGQPRSDGPARGRSGAAGSPRAQ